MSGRRVKSCSLRSDKSSIIASAWFIGNSEGYIEALLIEYLPVTAHNHHKTLNV
jgi:hypothetical protein